MKNYNSIRHLRGRYKFSWFQDLSVGKRQLKCTYSFPLKRTPEFSPHWLLMSQHKDIGAAFPTPPRFQLRQVDETGHTSPHYPSDGQTASRAQQNKIFFHRKENSFKIQKYYQSSSSASMNINGKLVCRSVSCSYFHGLRGFPLWSVYNICLSCGYFGVY